MALPCLPPLSFHPSTKDTVAFSVDSRPWGPEMTQPGARAHLGARTPHRGPECPGSWSLVAGERLLVLVWWGDWGQARTASGGRH